MEETGLENPLLAKVTLSADEDYAFLDKPAAELTPAERVAYKIWLGIQESDDPYARIDNPFNEDDANLVAAYEMLGMDFPTPPTFGDVIGQYEEENGEGSFAELSQGVQSQYLADNYVQEAWDYDAKHEYYNTAGSYDGSGFSGYDDEATYTYLPGQADNGNSGYQNLRPWDTAAVSMTTDDLRAEYQDSDNLQSTFASEDDFLNYVAEMNAAGLADTYTNAENNTVAQNEFQNNPIGQEIFAKYADAEGLTINGYEATNEMGDTFEWTGSSWMPVDRVYRPNTKGAFIKAAVGIGLGLATGQAAGSISAIGSLGGTASGAIQGALGSAISQGVVNGKVDPSSLLTAAILGGLSGFSDSLANMDSAIAEGGILGTADDIVSSASDLLNMGYDDTLALLQGMATGAISGGDLESIVAGAVGSYSSTKIQDLIRDSFGDTLNVDDWFKDGESNIPVEALNPIIEGTINAAIEGGMSGTDAIKMAWDYFSAGGDIDFMLPDSPEFTDWLGSLNIPDLDISKGDEWSWTQDEDGNINITWNLPSFDFDFDGELPQLGNPCTTAEGQEGKIFAGAAEGSFLCEGIEPFGCGEGETWNELLGNCVPDVVECIEGFEWDGQTCVAIPEGGGLDPFGCGEGETWSELLGNCVPDVVECMEGFEWDGQTCVEIPDVVECIEGFEWDGQTCVEIPDVVECIEGFEWDGQTCVEIPDVVECVEGFEWDGQTCVEIPDVVECMEGWEWSDLYGECVEKIPDDIDIVECMEGWEWSDLYGQCIEKFKSPEWELPDWESPDDLEFEWEDIDIDLPDLPDAPEPAPVAATPKESFKKQEQFAYTPFKGYTAKAPAQQQDFLKGKGLLK